MRRHGNVRLLLALPTVAVLATAFVDPASAKSRGDLAEDRKRTAVEMCARELKSREKGKSVRVDRTIRSDYRKDTVSWDGLHDRPAQQARPQRAAVLRGELRRQEPDHPLRDLGRCSSGSGGGNDQASRACWSEAERKGYDVAGVRDTSDAGSSGRLVVLRVDGRKELLCLYRGRPALYRSVCSSSCERSHASISPRSRSPEQLGKWPPCMTRTGNANRRRMLRA